MYVIIWNNDDFFDCTQVKLFETFDKCKQFLNNMIEERYSETIDYEKITYTTGKWDGQKDLDLFRYHDVKIMIENHMPE
jgi:hypothetical protein